MVLLIICSLGEFITYIILLLLMLLLNCMHIHNIVSVKGQFVTCRASANCTGGSGDNLGAAANGRSCCLDNPRALAYSTQGSEDCFACIVESGPCRSMIKLHNIIVLYSRDYNNCFISLCNDTLIFSCWILQYLIFGTRAGKNLSIASGLPKR